MFDRRFVGNTTPYAVFNGSFADRISGADKLVPANTYTRYEEMVSKLLVQQSTKPNSLLLGGKVTSNNGLIEADVVLTNISKDPIYDASLYAVIYERVLKDGTWRNVVKGITPVSEVKLGMGESGEYKLQHPNLHYSDDYGVVIILESANGSIMQAYQAK